MTLLIGACVLTGHCDRHFCVVKKVGGGLYLFLYIFIYMFIAFSVLTLLVG